MSMDDETGVRFEGIRNGYIDNIEEIFIEPPDPNSLTDEDSADEDSGGALDNLSGRKQRSKVEIRLANSTERLTSENQEDEDPLDTIAIDDESILPDKINLDGFVMRLQPLTNVPPPTVGELPKKKTVVKNVDRVLNNFGRIVEEESSNLDIENNRRCTKKNCSYRFTEVTHFPRLLGRNHSDEGAVGEILRLSINDPKRKVILDSLRGQGNDLLNSKMK
ncbi:hypothetical protein JTB14_004459 [Gonioctena quinquepunctata]|nr:hypothetical protein JTB14_004459 [Gonioctena quinquepunctata]